MFLTLVCEDGLLDSDRVVRGLTVLILSVTFI